MQAMQTKMQEVINEIFMKYFINKIPMYEGMPIFELVLNLALTNAEVYCAASDYIVAYITVGDDKYTWDSETMEVKLMPKLM